MGEGSNQETKPKSDLKSTHTGHKCEIPKSVTKCPTLPYSQDESQEEDVSTPADASIPEGRRFMEVSASINYGISYHAVTAS